MKRPVQTTQPAAFSQSPPAARQLFLFTPLVNEQNQLIDLQLLNSNPASSCASSAPIYFSDWLASQSSRLEPSFWQALQAGHICSLAYRLPSGGAGPLTVTPLQNGYLVELPTDPVVSPTTSDPLLETPIQAVWLPDRSMPQGLPGRTIPFDEHTHWLEAMVAHAPAGLALLEPVRLAGQITDFVFLFTNPAHAALTGRRVDQIRGLRFKAVFPTAASPGLFDRLVGVAQSGLSQQYQKQITTDGLAYWGQFTLSRVGPLVLFTVLDISLLVETKANLRQKNTELQELVSERTRQMRDLSIRHEAILTHAGQAILSTDPQGVIQTANPACATLFGYPTSELIGRTARLRAQAGADNRPVVGCYQRPVEESPNALFQGLLQQQDYWQQECWLLSEDGHLTPVLLTVSRLTDEQGDTAGYVGIATDITALKQAEARLHQKSREVSTFFEGALDMHSISDSQGQFSEVNYAFHQTLGYSAQELRAIPFLYLIHPDEQPQVYQQLLKNILQQPVRHQVNRFRKKDGTYRIFEWNAIGIDQTVYGSARDITARHQQEGELNRLAHRLRLATRAAGQGIWENDLERQEIIWDERLWALHGLVPSLQTPTYTDYVDLIYPEDRASFLTKRQLELPGTQNRVEGIYRVQWPDGTIHWLETHGHITRNAEGRAQRMIGVSWDVTERKRAEESLRESEQRFRQIADHVEEIFWVHSAEPFELLYINPAYERIWQRSSQSLYQDTTSFMDGTLPQDLPAVQAFFEQYRAGHEGQLDYQLQRPDGSWRYLSVRSFMVRDEAGQLTRHLGIIRDITSQKEKEVALQQTLVREQELNQLKSQFVANASHEFRTPLTTIQSSVELIKLYLAKPTATSQASVQKHLGVIEAEIGQFNSLLGDLLMVSTIESGKVRYHPQWVDLVALCQQVLATHFSGPTDPRRAVLQIEGRAVPVYLDEKLMGHVLVNLLNNAFKYSPAAGPRLVLVFKPGRVVLSVIDTGIGIPASELPNLFQSFFRASNTEGISGTGLGLVIARQFVELQGGRLTVESQERQGTTFRIELP